MSGRDERTIRLGLVGTGLATERLHWPALAKLGQRFEVTAFLAGNQGRAPELAALPL